MTRLSARPPASPLPASIVAAAPAFALIVLAMVVGLNSVAEAFLVQTFETRTGRTIRQSWASDEVTYLIDARGSDDMQPSTAIQVLRESFAVWEAVDSASIRFTDSGTSSGRAPTSADGRNLVIFDENGTWLDPPPGSGVIAVTRIESNASGSITDADIIFNGRDFRFASGAVAGVVNLKDVAVHEIGHLLGLDHTPLDGPAALRPTMNPFYGGDGPGEASSLEPDDVAGLSYLYPAPTFELATGVITGAVSNLEAEAVFGAHVTAENTSTGETFSTVSGAFPDRGDPGSYFLIGLTPGSYQLQLRPISGGISEDNFGGIFEDFTTGFPVEYYDNASQSPLAVPVDVQAGEQTSGIDFTTGFEAGTGISIVPLAIPNNTPDSDGPYRVQVRATEAQRVSLTYRLEEAGGGVQGSLAMRPLTASTYSVDIPGQQIGSRVFYRITATDADGMSATYPAADQWLRFDVLALSGSPLAYTVLREEEVVGVFDTGSERELARIPVGSDPIQILPSADGRLLFVSNLASDDVTVVETATFRMTARIDVADEPLDLAPAPDGSAIYIANSGASSLTALDVRTLETRELVIPDLVEGPFGIAAAAGKLFVTDMGTNEIIALDLDGRVSGRLQLPDSPRSLATSPDGSTLYATSFTTPQLAFIDAATLQLTDLVDLPLSGSFAVGTAPDGRKLYVTGHFDNAVVVVDAIEPTVLKSIPIGDNPRALSFSTDGERLLVTSAESDEIHVIDTATDEVVDAYAIGGRPRGIAVLEPRASAEVPTAVAELPLPHVLSLSLPFPNPFNAATQIRFSLPEGAAGAGEPVTLAIYSVLGQRLRTLTSGPLEPGAHTVAWDASDDAGKTVAAGMYLVSLQTPGARAVTKVMFLK